MAEINPTKRPKQINPSPLHMEKIKKTIALISNKITSITHVFGLLAIVVGALLLIYDARYLLSFGDGWNYINNIMVEAHGLFFDLMVLGFLISIYERRRQKKEAIEREKNLIDDFRGWNEKEAMYRIVGAVKRLNRLGESKIQLLKCFLNHADLTTINLEGANLSSSCLQKAQLHKANLSFANLISADFSFAKLRSANIKMAHLDYADLINADLFGTDLSGTNFFYANLEGANLDHANLSNAKLYRANLVGATFLESNLEGVEIDEAKVGIGEDWFEILEFWKVKGVSEIKQKYKVDQDGLIKLRKEYIHNI